MADRDRLHLLVMVGTGGVMEFDLSAGVEYAIGRAPDAAICIDAPSVSRNHALLAIGEGIILSDCGSTNGTFVNGRQVGSEPVPIGVDDALSFGDVVAQLRRARSRTRVLARSISAASFDARLAEEAERSARFDRPLAIAAIELADPDDYAVSRAHRAMVTSLRSSDLVTSRGPGRIDVLLPECPPADLGVIARRMRLRLLAASLPARIGVASYPGTVTVPDSVLLAAQLALRAAGPDAVAEAGEGARILKIGAREIVVADAKMARLFNLIEQVAGAGRAVLVHGEAGSDREMVAEAIHALGPRRAQRLVVVDCAATPDHLPFAAADGGTIFLDEVGELPLEAQAEVMRVLEDGRVDVSVVAGSRRRLDELVTAGRFRQDLHVRLAAVVLEVPPLRQRPREIALLAARRAAARSGAPAEDAAPARAQDSAGTVQVEIDLRQRDTESLPPLRRIDEETRQLERSRMAEALAATQGNQLRAAELIGMPPRTFYAKVKEYGLSAGRPRGS